MSVLTFIMPFILLRRSLIKCITAQSINIMVWLDKAMTFALVSYQHPQNSDYNLAIYKRLGSRLCFTFFMS